MPGWLAESLGISLAAQAATLPDVLATFGRLSLVSPVVNLAVVPLVPAAMLGGVVAMLGGAREPARRAAAGRHARGPAGLDRAPRHRGDRPVRGRRPVRRGHAAAGRRGGRCGRGRRRDPRRPGRRPRGSGAAARHARRRSTRASPAGGSDDGRRRSSDEATRIGLAAAALVVAIVGRWRSATRSSGTTRLTVLDVGQGDAILLETRTGARMLVDGGPDPDRVLLALDARIPPWDRRLDIVVLTHPHEDHVAGLARILERYRVGRVYEPGMHGPGPRLGGLGRGPPRRTAARPPRDRRAAPPRRGPAVGPVAGPGRRAARAARHRHRRSTTSRSCSWARRTAAGSC